MSDQTTVTTTGEAGASTPATGERTFTQEQLNAIVGERLAKERTKAEGELAERERQIQQKEFAFTAKETLTQRGLPLELLDAINASDQETLTKSLDILENSITGMKPLSPAASEAIKAQLITDGANPLLVDLLVHAFDAKQVQFDGKTVTNWANVSKPVKEKYAVIFGTTTVRGTEVANPPHSNPSEPDLFKEGFKSK